MNFRREFYVFLLLAGKTMRYFSSTGYVGWEDVKNEGGRYVKDLSVETPYPVGPIHGR